MTNRNFEHIDKLFREGLDRSDDHLNFQEDGWLKLKERLNRNEKRKRGFFWLSRLSGVAALILLLFTIRMLLPEGRKPIIQQAEVQQNDHKLKKAEQSQPTASAEVKKKVSKTESISNAVLAQNRPKKMANARKKDFESNSMLAQNKPSGEQLPQKDFTIRSTEINTSENDTSGVEDLSVQKATANQTVDVKEHKLTQQDMVKSAEQKRPSADETLFAPNERPNELPEPEHQYRKLALSVLAAPDYNGVNNLNNASIGNDFGLLVTYKISKNWSLSTGGVYAKKLYETGFSNYNPTKNIWDEYYPKTVNADCRVLDIPLNISYTFLVRKNTTVSVGSGISSYIMLREDYRFSYAEQDAETAVAYHVVNENQHWLSVLNFQATFEQRLNSRVSIGLQPYMKIPLSNIGFAGVKLQSLGMAVILNWNFN
jgi:hypothetical protein